MTEVELTRWPRVVVTLDDGFAEADLAALAGAVQSALERRCPFVVAIVAPRRLLDARSDEAAPLRWLSRRRADVGTWCRGVAYVVSDELDPRAQEQRLPDLERLWRSAVAVFASFDAAIAWLEQCLRPAARASEGEQ